MSIAEDHPAAGAPASAPSSSKWSWGTGWRQRLRLAPLYLAMRAADRLARARAGAPSRPAEPARPGLSVVIPDRDAPEMLAEALRALYRALECVAEPRQVIVVANGAPAAAYDDLRRAFPRVEFVHSTAPLGFGGAIERGLARAHHDWTLLLNNDMTLAPGAIAALVELRAPDVFAVAAQIFQQSADGRREETGLVDWYADDTGVHVFHAPVRDDGVRPHLAASGGAALFRTAPLRRYVRASRCYDPFYWEDIEWGVRAWRDGMRVLFCSGAHATHRHRATTARFYAAAEIDRIVERNRLLFDARHAATAQSPAWLMERVCHLPYASQRELTRWAQAAGVFVQRLRRHRQLPHGNASLLHDPSGRTGLRSSFTYRVGEDADAAGRTPRPRLLLVSPFAVYPPRHGGARRIAELLTELRRHYDVVFVSDEAVLYDARSLPFIDGLYAVRLVQRVDSAVSSGGTLADWVARHCHPRLIATVRTAIDRYQPAVVQIEHVELAPLVRIREPGPHWILGLHDAYGAQDFGSGDAGARFESEILAAYDAITVCSENDRALVRHPRVVCVPNGSRAPDEAYRPSQSSRILFVGPFRYVPNLDGIRAFLREAWPAIKASVPAAELLVLGGDEGVALAKRHDEFAQPGVAVSGHRDDVPALLRASALTVNPLAGIRGSAVKLVESLMAGRICVSTTAGARGFENDALAALVTVPDVPQMVEPIVELLTEPEVRHRREVPESDKLERYRWDRCAAVQLALYAELLDARVG